MSELLTADWELLKLIGENSGRKSYITDREFDLLWSNSDVPLAKVVASLKISVFGRAIRKESIFPCGDGRALKVTPVIRSGEVLYYLFEIYGTNELIAMLSATSVFRKFSAAADKVHSMMIGYAASLSVSAGAVNDSAYGKLCSSAVNLMSLMKILGDSEPLVIEDFSARLRQIAGWFAKAAARTGGIGFEYDIDNELLALAGRNALEYAAVNLLVNAAMHSVPPEGGQVEVRMTAYLDHGKVCILTDDNGTKADPERVSSFREIFTEETVPENGEGLGIALAESFCKRSGGELILGRSPLGGLRAEMRLPACSEREKFALYAPSVVCPDMQGIADIFLKCFDKSALREIVRGAEDPGLIG